jgi:hypothetical protein
VSSPYLETTTWLMSSQKKSASALVKRDNSKRDGPCEGPSLLLFT